MPYPCGATRASSRPASGREPDRDCAHGRRGVGGRSDGARAGLHGGRAAKRAEGTRCHDRARVCIVKLERLRVDVHWRDVADLAGGARCRLLQHIVTDVDCNELEPVRNVRDVQPGLHTEHDRAITARPACLRTPVGTPHQMRDARATRVAAQRRGRPRDGSSPPPSSQQTHGQRCEHRHNGRRDGVLNRLLASRRS